MDLGYPVSEHLESPFWTLLELRMMEMVVTTGDIRRSKLQSNYHHQPTPSFYMSDALPVVQPSVKSTEGREGDNILSSLVTVKFRKSQKFKINQNI